MAASWVRVGWTRYAAPQSSPDARQPGAGSAEHAAGTRPFRREHQAEAAIRRLALPAADTAALAAAVTVSAAARGAAAGLACICYVLAVLLILMMSGQHRLRICLRSSDQADRILIAAALPVLALLTWLPAARLAWLALCSAAFILIFRTALYTVMRAAHRRDLLTEKTLIVGAGTFGAYLADLLGEHPELGLRSQGLLDSGPQRRDLPVPSLGTPADLASVVTALGIHRVIVCFPACRDEDMVAVIRASRPLRADICVVPRLYELGAAVPRSSLDEIWGIPLIPLRRYGQSPAHRALKRATDLVAALILLAMSAPVLLVMAAVVRLKSGQPALFRQVRITGPDRAVPVLKLRTLIDGADPDTSWAAVTQRHGPLGRWLRATHLDELPQLLNVVRGDMSLVGPRPERPFFAERFSREIPRYADRTRVPAGMTGWAQVHGLNGDTSIFERARFDNYYAEYWSPWLDAVILARTIATVTSGRPGDRR